ncbi:MAG: hypothetical protein ACYDGN_16350 [Acidimicrobiales bacterium]
MTRHLRSHPLVVVAACVFVGLLLEPVVLAAICVVAAGMVIYSMHLERRQRNRQIIEWLMGQGFENDTLGEISESLTGVTFKTINAERAAFEKGWREGFQTPRRGARI